MAITEQAKLVIERPLDKSRIKSRKGGQGMTFDYIGTEHAIQLLNEAFDYSWDSRVVEHDIVAGGSLAIALIEIKVWDSQGSPIVKQQFGSCNINKGVDTGSALKGAASDGLKKCASQLGVALELYLDDAPSGSGFKAPVRPAAKPAVPSAPAASPPRPTSPAAPPSRPTPPAPPAGAARPNPFTGQGSPNTASVPKPPTPVAAPPAAPPASPRPAISAPPPIAANSSVTRPNPFGGNDTAKGITTVQMSALTSLAAKKGVSQTDLVALADVMDAQGTPKQTFEELTHSEAIEVVKAAQR